jgi:four helix bundle protein
MDKQELQMRLKQYALRIIRLSRALPNSPEGWIVKKQIIRCGTSVGANYRAACRARSKAEFIAKLGIVIEEADESAWWLEIIIEAGLMKKNLVTSLLQETNEILAIMIGSRTTAQKRL